MYLNFLYVNSILILFINFYVRTYVLRRGSTSASKAEDTNIISNGTKVTSNGTASVLLEDKKHY